MDEDNKAQIKQEDAEEKTEGKEKAAKASSAPKSGGGVFVGLQFLSLFVMIGVILLQYVQFNKLEDIEKRMIEKNEISALSSEDEITVPEVPLSDIVTFPLVASSNYNISDGKNTKTLIITINLGLNKKAKKYKATSALLGEKLEVAKEIVETIIRSSDVSDLDGAGKEYDLKTKIISQLSKQFETDAIVTVYFSDKFIA